MWVTLQASLSPGMLSNIRLMSLKSSSIYPLSWKAIEKGQVSKCIKAHTNFTPMQVPGLPRQHPLQWCHSCWEGSPKGQSQTFWWQSHRTATGTTPCKLLHNASEVLCCPTVLSQLVAELQQLLRLVCWLFFLPGHQYLICSPSLRWIHHCLSEPAVPNYYQRVVLHTQERTNLGMKASSNDAWVSWRWASPENPCMGTICRFTLQKHSAMASRSYSASNEYV